MTAALLVLAIVLPIAASVALAILDFRFVRWLRPAKMQGRTVSSKTLWIAVDALLALPIVAPLVWAILGVAIALLATF